MCCTLSSLSSWLSSNKHYHVLGRALFHCGSQVFRTRQSVLLPKCGPYIATKSNFLSEYLRPYLRASLCLLGPVELFSERDLINSLILGEILRLSFLSAIVSVSRGKAEYKYKYKCISPYLYTYR